ncbi:MAG: hypothetical protein KGZ39_06075 [Simkania sp.]|nr:hypothetical protein [Simkania sp.]
MTLAEINAVRQAFRPEEPLRDTKQSESASLRLTRSSLETLEAKKSEVSLRPQERYWQWLLDYAETEMKIVNSISNILAIRKLNNALIVYQKSMSFLESKDKIYRESLEKSRLTPEEEKGAIAQIEHYQRIKTALLLHKPTTSSSTQEKAEKRWATCIEEARNHLAEIRETPISTIPHKSEKPANVTASSLIAALPAGFEYLGKTLETPESLHLGIQELLQPLQTKLRSISQKIGEKEARLLRKKAFLDTFSQELKSHDSSSLFDSTESEINNLEVEIKTLTNRISDLNREEEECAHQLNLLYEFFKQEKCNWV